MSITFSHFRNPNWEDKINLELNAYLESVTNQHSPQTQGIYCFHETQHIGGVLFQKNENILWIDGMFVATSFRGQGIGRSLINEVIKYAKHNQVQSIQLNTYFPEARQFFKSCEFEEVATIPNWKYGLTCFLLEKNI